MRAVTYRLQNVSSNALASRVLDVGEASDVCESFL
jgi:hypothetical protein